MTPNGSKLTPAADTVIDDDAIGNVIHTNASEFCLDVSYAGRLEVWVGRLSGGRRTVAMLNRSPSSDNIVVMWKDIGIDADESQFVRDVWSGQDKGAHTGQYSALVPPHGVALLVLSPGPA